MKKKHPHYKNSTIIEAVIEIFFVNALQTSDLQKLQETLGSQFDCKKDELVTYTATVQPSGPSIKSEKPGQIRLVMTLDSNTFAHLYQNRLSFHLVGKYPGWDVFSDKLVEFLELLKKASQDVESQRIGVRFINKLDSKSDDQKVGHWLKPSANYPEHLLAAQNDYFYRGRWPSSSQKLIQVCITEVEANNQHSRPLIFDIDVIEFINTPSRLSEIIKLAANLHEDVYDVFDSSISSHYRKVLNQDRGDN